LLQAVEDNRVVVGQDDAYRHGDVHPRSGVRIFQTAIGGVSNDIARCISSRVFTQFGLNRKIVGRRQAEIRV